MIYDYRDLWIYICLERSPTIAECVHATIKI